MRTLLKILLVLVVVVLLAAGGGVAYLFAKYPDVPPVEDMMVSSTPEKIARGAATRHYGPRPRG